MMECRPPAGQSRCRMLHWQNHIVKSGPYRRPGMHRKASVGHIHTALGQQRCTHAKETTMMSCSHLLAPDDEELLAHVLDEQPLSESGRHHLEHCPTCQHRLNDYQRMHTFYRS